MLAAIERRPGATAREIAEATGVSVNVVHATLSKLPRAGVIERDAERGHRIATGSG